uniref:Uncharacterized protein n=1 Tax=Cereibacter sphaeroides (strain ATCC 17025 / ATH 2.4.3) TaxID=349102 RepID=A4X026_CERS5
MRHSVGSGTSAAQCREMLELAACRINAPATTGMGKMLLSFRIHKSAAEPRQGDRIRQGQEPSRTPPGLRLHVPRYGTGSGRVGKGGGLDEMLPRLHHHRASRASVTDSRAT